MTYTAISNVDTMSGVMKIGVPGECRYCKEKEPNVSFKKVAHSIPHALGNNMIFSVDECDSCNERFGQGYDDDLSKYLGAGRTLSQIHGKSGVPSYRTRRKLSRIDVSPDGMKLINTDGDDMISLNKEEKTLTVTIEKQPYSPLGVYKSFVKMALAISPDSLLPSLELTRQWLMRDDVESFPYFRPFMLQTFIPGPGPGNNELFALLLQRTTDDEMPAIIFWLTVSNYCFQLPIPCAPLDQNLAGKSITMPRIPHLLEELNSYGDGRCHKIDLSSREKVRNEINNYTMSYSEIIPKK